jgi:hypothetical protein
VISLQSFAVLVHEATCYGSDECVYINTSSDEAANEYDYFRLIIQDLKLLRSTDAEDSKYLLRKFEPTQAGYELLAAHNIYFHKENHE